MPPVPDAASVAPEIRNLVYSPQAVTPDPSSDSGEQTISVPVEISVTASAPEGELREVAFVIQPPTPSLEPVASGALVPDGSGRHATSLTAEFPRGGVGKYTVLVYAVSEAGRVSNTLRGHINYVAEGGPPVILDVLADPDTILVSQHTILVLTAVVDDPDGLENLNRVVVRTPNQQEFPMFDDGVSVGDPVAGDGRYTARFSGVNQATPNTTQVFSFQAFDRTGLSSEIVEKAVRIEQ